jgi:hypothetical protein
MDGSAPSVVDRKVPVLVYNEKRCNGYNLGTLATARAAFCEAYKMEVDWPADDNGGTLGDNGPLPDDDCPF